MKTIFLILMVCVAGMVIGCSSVYDVQYDYDQETDFSQLQTYDWLPTPEGADIDDISIERVKKAVNAELKAKGFQSVLTGSRLFDCRTHGCRRKGPNQQLGICLWSL